MTYQNLVNFLNQVEDSLKEKQKKLEEEKEKSCLAKAARMEVFIIEKLSEIAPVFVNKAEKAKATSLDYIDLPNKPIEECIAGVLFFSTLLIGMQEEDDRSLCLAIRNKRGEYGGKRQVYFEDFERAPSSIGRERLFISLVQELLLE